MTRGLILVLGAITFGLSIWVMVTWILKPASLAIPVVRYGSDTICDDAFNQHLDFSDQNINHFDIPMTEGCFGGFVTVPKSWRDWRTQPVGSQQNWWSAIWWENDHKAYGPFPPNNKTEIPHPIHAAFRLQGHGTIRFYTNVAGAAPPPKTRTPEDIGDAPPLKPDSLHETYRMMDPGVTPPRPIARVEPNYTEEARRVHFEDTVTTAVIIDENGRVHDITFPDPPGYGLEEQIRKALHEWKFHPAEKDGKPVAIHSTISITFHLR